MAQTRTIKPRHCHCYNVISLDYLRCCVFFICRLRHFGHLRMQVVKVDYFVDVVFYSLLVSYLIVHVDFSSV